MLQTPLANNVVMQVIALDNLSLGKTSNLSDKVKFVKRSIMDYELMLKVTKGCGDYVFRHTANHLPMFTPDPREGIDTLMDVCDTQSDTSLL